MELREGGGNCLKKWGGTEKSGEETNFSKRGSRLSQGVGGRNLVANYE